MVEHPSKVTQVSAVEHPNVILFDGVCNLCSGVVKFIIKRDPRGRFGFAALQSEAGQRLLADAGMSEMQADSVVLVVNGQAYVKSNAALRIASKLNGLWPLFYAFVVIPRPLRDVVYDFVARNRYRWFGKQDACMMPTPDTRRRFLE